MFYSELGVRGIRSQEYRSEAIMSHRELIRGFNIKHLEPGGSVLAYPSVNLGHQERIQQGRIVPKSIVRRILSWVKVVSIDRPSYNIELRIFYL